ncbi:MAG: 50S ribosomal protein L11 methyltransferase [Anaerolineales bacterium]
MAESIQKTEWEHFRVEIDQDWAEELEVLLGNILPGSLVVEKNYGDLFLYELPDYQGPVIIHGYYPVGVSSKIRSQILAALQQAGCTTEPEFTPLKIENWATAWQSRYQPIPLGQRLIVVPSWLENPQPDRLAIIMDPGGSFGSGTHPTTQLSLELLESWITQAEPFRMIDIGCGSGILSIAGAKLGLNQVLGVDVDPEAVEISRQNAVDNLVSERTDYRLGSVKELLELGADKQPSPLVVANIIAPILDELFHEGLGKLVSVRGCLILSGILETQAEGIQDWLERSGFEIREKRQKGEWVGLVAVKQEVRESGEPYSQV